MKALYWIVTVLAALGLGLSGFGHLSHQPPMIAAMKSLGYPEYMLTILGTFKLLGAIALLVPRFPPLKEWAYAGSVFLLIGAAWSHLACGQAPAGPILVLVFVISSYILYHRFILGDRIVTAA